jgi:ubiquinone/menaquinone biosynthesis C-methylase UbiE
MRDFNKIDFLIQKKRIKLIEKYVPPDSYVLDIGCGHYPQNLINLENKITKAVGIDKDIPDRDLSGKISFIKVDIKKTLPLPDNEFDCILILAVLEHLDYPPEIIRECYRILKPGGRLIITIPSNYSKPLLLILAGLGIISREEIFSHKYYFSRKEAEHLLLKAGFKKIVSKAYNFGLNALFVLEK